MNGDKIEPRSKPRPVEPRSKLRNVSTQSQKRRILRGLSDDTLLKFLIDAAQDANDPRITRYPNEDKDIQEILFEILTRMDAARVLALKEQDEQSTI